MKRTLLAALVAATFATPVVAANTIVVSDPFAASIIDIDIETPMRLHYDKLAAAEEVRAQSDAWRRWADDFSHDLRASLGTLYGPRMGASKVVKGAPYSAQVTTEMNQPLADGNVINHKTTGAVYRDGEGRTRQETAGDGKERSVFINDPVESKHIVLNPGAKRAIVMPGHTGHPKVVVKTIDEKESGDGTRREEIRVQVVRSGDPAEIAMPVSPVPPVAPTPPGSFHLPPPIPPIPPLPGVHTLRFEGTGKLGKGVTTNLGTKEFDGVKAEGKSTAWTIPAGQIGNRNPIVVTSESWYAPELQVTVYSRYSDPRTGESIYRLAAIRRGEPARDLFAVPEGYEAKARGKREEKK